jgi:hypothetical protein
MTKISYKQLSDFLLLESSKLEKIDLDLKSFNPFDVLKIAEYEIRHSNFLAWIFDPNGSHRFDDYVLRRFLGELSGIPDDKRIEYLLNTPLKS